MKSPCNFVRKAAKGGRYEFGRIEITDIATPKEKRTYVVVGNADTYEEALTANNMALEGQRRVKHHGLDLKPLWRN